MGGWRFIRALVLGAALGVLLVTVPARAGVLDASWTAPTKNTDGSALTDLAYYRVYYTTSTSPCHASTFLQVASTTTSPPSGQVVSARLRGLATGARYYVAVSAVDNGGNESPCSASANAVAQISYAVSPTTTVDFGSMKVGSYVDRSFTVSNTRGGTVSGTATASAPFSVVSGSSFTLVGLGASQTVTVRFTPTISATVSTNISFSADGDRLSRLVTGTGTGTSTTTSTTTSTSTVLSVSPSSVAPGGSVTASWSGIASPTSTDWIGLYASGAANGSYLAWMYVSCSQTAGSAKASGSCAFPIPKTVAVGKYELRLFKADSYTRLATSPTLTVTTTTTTTTLSVTPTSVAAGSPVTATWSGIASPTAWDWIGLYAPGTADSAKLAWIYVSCSQTVGTAKASGSCAFPIPKTVAAGMYELRLFGPGATRLATSPTFTVTTTTATLSVTPTSVAAGSSVTASWSGIASPTSTDWIGLYASGAADGSYLAWMYVSCSQTVGSAKASGSCAFKIPATVAAGTYQLRLFAANGYTRLATSNSFSVTK
jgi:hypothetical protein